MRNGLSDERLGVHHLASMLGRTVRQVNGSVPERRPVNRCTGSITAALSAALGTYRL